MLDETGKVSRRQFLRGASSAAVVSLLIASGVPSTARATAHASLAQQGVTLDEDFYTQRPTWEPVADGHLAGLELAGIAVPLDYARPDGPATEITIGRHRATDPAQRLGVLLVGPGDNLGNPGLEPIPVS